MNTSIYLAIGGLVATFIAKEIIDFIFYRLERRDRDEAVARLDEALRLSEERMKERMCEFQERAREHRAAQQKEKQ